MQKKFKYIIASISIFVIIFFLITLVNQLFGFIDIISRYSEFAGQIAFMGISVLLIIIVVAPLYYVVRLPARLEYPSSDDEKSIRIYKKKLCRNLNKNKYIKKSNIVVDENHLSEALHILDKEARKEVNRISAIVFISTAISQSGKLDSFVVLSLLVKMVWKVAHIYNQRPAVTDLINLYANVAGTTLIAGSIEEIDMSEQMEPVIAELLGSTALSAVPGLSQITEFGFRCVMEGSINAFLALRMGEVTIGYSNSITNPNRKLMRKFATIKAIDSLRIIVKENGKDVLKALFNASKKRFAWTKPTRKDDQESAIQQEKNVTPAFGFFRKKDITSGEEISVPEIPEKEQEKILNKILSIWSTPPDKP
jgi:hypothetical protein